MLLERLYPAAINRLDRYDVQVVETFAAPALYENKPSLYEHSQVLHYGEACYRKLSSQLTGSSRTLAKKV